jgi:biopolymer transport protein ExbD
MGKVQAKADLCIVSKHETLQCLVDVGESIMHLPPQAESRDVMLDMNMTPLIDVLLVLLVMLIITIPLQTHAVKMDLPGATPPVAVERVRNVLMIAPTGGLSWNGQAVSLLQLRDLLDRSVAAAVAPELHIQPAASAPYGVVDEVLAMTKKAEVTRVGFVGNEAYRRF